MNKPYVIPPNGTVRGPFKCRLGAGVGTGREGVQFAIQTKDGWRYVIGDFRKEGDLRKEAEKISAFVKLAERITEVNKARMVIRMNEWKNGNYD